MRFGIMAMQINSLVPASLPPAQLAGYIATFDHAALVSGLADAGFDLIELGGDLSLFLPQTYTPAAIQRLAALKTERGLSFTVHLPLWSVEPSTPLTPVREGSTRALIEIIRATRPLQPESYVLHATGALAAEFYRMRLPETARPLILRHFFQNGARQSVRTILRETGLPSRQLAIETVEFPFELTLELAEEFDLSICLDTGHILASFAGELDFFETLERCLPRLGEIHLHDCPRLAPGEIGYGKDHQPLGAGDLPLPRFLDRLAEANFNGPIIFELRVEQALASLEVVRGVRPGYL